MNLALFSILLLALLFAFRHVLFGTYIKKFIADQVNTHTGIDLSIADVKGTYFSSRELSGIKTNGGSPVTVLKLNDAERIAFLLFPAVPAFGH